MSYILKSLAAATLIADLASAKVTEAPYFYRSDRPLVVSHRGAFGHAPEESLASFVDAYYGGADFLELDLQVSKDNHLMVQHDSTLNNTTNIYEYGGRWEDLQRDDGNWYVEDFSLAQLKMLRRFQRYQETRSPMLNDRYEMITVNELIENVIMLNEDAPRTQNKDTKPGLYIELKDYDDYLTKGWDTAEMLFDVLDHYGLSNWEDASKKIPIIIQSFDANALIKMSTMTDLPLLLLCHDTDIYDYNYISSFANGVGVPLAWIMKSEKDVGDGDSDYSAYIKQMHKLDLAVHPYTDQDDKLTYGDNVYD